MNSKQVVNALAVLAAIVVMVGVTFAARSALAEESAIIASPALADHETADREAASQVDAVAGLHAQAAEEAAARIADTNRLDLDIRFFDHRSETVADGR